MNRYAAKHSTMYTYDIICIFPCIVAISLYVYIYTYTSCMTVDEMFDCLMFGTLHLYIVRSSI